MSHRRGPRTPAPPSGGWRVLVPVVGLCWTVSRWYNSLSVRFVASVLALLGVLAVVAVVTLNLLSYPVDPPAEAGTVQAPVASPPAPARSRPVAQPTRIRVEMPRARRSVAVAGRLSPFAAPRSSSAPIEETPPPVSPSPSATSGRTVEPTISPAADPSTSP